MTNLEFSRKPSKLDQKLAGESYSVLTAAMDHLTNAQPAIELAETQDKIKLPVAALQLLADVLKAMSQGKLISIVPLATEITTQAAAEMLGCSRPHLVKLLDEGKIAYTKVGKHRRIRYEDIVNYKSAMKAQQKQYLIDMMNADEETGLYDS